MSGTQSWSMDLPAWQRDALRRLCDQTTLDATERTPLVSIRLKA